MSKVIISGAAGRMGRSLIGGVQESNEFTLFGALESEGNESLGMDAGESRWIVSQILVTSSHQQFSS